VGTGFPARKDGYRWLVGHGDGERERGRVEEGLHCLLLLPCVQRDGTRRRGLYIAKDCRERDDRLVWFPWVGLHEEGREGSRGG
jgi:hypothetical protein